MLTPAALAALLRHYHLPPRRPNWPLLLQGWCDELLRAVILAIIAVALLRLLGW